MTSSQYSTQAERDAYDEALECSQCGSRNVYHRWATNWGRTGRTYTPGRYSCRDCQGDGFANHIRKGEESP